MEFVEGRGIECNGVCFIFDAEMDVVVMAMYRDLPGVRGDLLQPNIEKVFTKIEWGEINDFLLAGASEMEVDDFDEDEDEAKEAESSPLFQQIGPETSKANGIPKMSNAEAILPENKVPAMTKEEMKEDGKEV